MTKVAILIKDLSNLGGLEKDSWYCALSFARLGCDVTVLTTGEPLCGPWPMHESISILSLGERPFLSVRHIRQFNKRARQWLKQHPHDITFGLDQNTELNFLRAGNGSHAMALQQRSVFEGLFKRLSFRFNPLHRTLLSFEKKLLKSEHLKKIFTNSHMIRNDLMRRYNIPGDKIDVVYNGVEWKAYTEPFENFEKERPEILKKEALHDSNLQLLFVGSGFARKGLLPLLKALIPFKFEPIELVVLGKDKNLKFYEDFCLKAGIASKVRFMGPRLATPFYQVADWCCIPSFYDPCANVTLEALAMGVPVISSKFNGGYELIDESNGLVVEDILDTEAFSAQIAKALKRRKSMGNARIIRDNMWQFEFENQFAEMASSCLKKI